MEVARKSKLVPAVPGSADGDATESDQRARSPEDVARGEFDALYFDTLHLRHLCQDVLAELDRRAAPTELARDVELLGKLCRLLVSSNPQEGTNLSSPCHRLHPG